MCTYASKSAAEIVANMRIILLYLLRTMELERYRSASVAEDTSSSNETSNELLQTEMEQWRQRMKILHEKENYEDKVT